MTKILLVEDDKSLREIYGVRLQAEGYEITSAGDGEEALAMAIKERPGLIVSDVMMPKISGFDMLDILRSTTETKDIKVIMMTALSSEDQRARVEDVVRTVHDVLGDGVSTPQTAAQTFGTPAPSAVARPTIPIPVTPTASPIATPAASVPTVPQLQPVSVIGTPPAVTTPAPAPVLAPTTYSVPPVINTPPAVPVTSPPQPFQPAPNPLPQPTAPFSSKGPASLADRVINPLSDPPPVVDMGNLMNQELSGAAATPAPSQPSPSDSSTPPAPQI